jgi:hypothetical protein
MDADKGLCSVLLLLLLLPCQTDADRQWLCSAVHHELCQTMMIAVDKVQNPGLCLLC